jgi:acyl transferase domain-containing protein/acyl carrier protein
MSNPAISTGVDQLAIAIVGMAGRFPGAKTIDQYWENLCNGVESIVRFTDDELLATGVSQATLADPAYVPYGAALDDIDLFDAAFFGFNPREVQITDPQHRLFLECAWEALEQAGYNPETYAGLIGVYAGSSLSSYLFHLFMNRNHTDAVDDFQVLIGNEVDFLSTRVSYKLGLKGPSASVQTACSTSLVAVQLACHSLQSYQCDMVLAGGVSIHIPQKQGYLYQSEGILSRDGHCRAFDAQASGVVDGNGVGVVLLKRLADAIADGDHIYAVIKGAAINNDGALKVGFTAPSEDGEAEVIAEALGIADVEPDSIGYIETHGTGTSLGDPIEIAALTKVFRSRTERKDFCAIGSVKTNIGHLDAAAGIAGLIKAALILQHKCIPPSLHFTAPNPQIDFANSPFYVNTSLTDWPTTARPRRAGVSSFGIGGTNAHVILEQAPDSTTTPSRQPAHLLLLSAKTPTALETATANMARHLRQHPNLNMADVAYSLQIGRRAFQCRRMLVCQDAIQAVARLESCDPYHVFTATSEEAERPVVFMFPGGGAQYIGMGYDLYEREPSFRKQVDMCAELLQPLMGLDLRAIIYPADNVAEEATQQMRRTSLALPALFTLEYALAKLLMSWGVQPRAMIGHSLGEYVAACLSGVFTLQEALELVVRRGQLLETIPAGSMLSIQLPAGDVQALIDERLSIAAINAPSQCVVAGLIGDIDQLVDELQRREIEFRSIQIDVAAHSRLVEPILEQFTKCVAALQLQTPKIPFVSNVTGTWITDQQATDPQYWAQHLRQMVHFAQGMSQILANPGHVLLEVGPGRTLSTLARQQPAHTPDRVNLLSLRHPQTQQNDVTLLLTTLGKLWLAGVPVQWQSFWAHEQRRRQPLPTYPFERQRYWVDAVQLAANGIRATNEIGKQPDIARWFYTAVWKQAIRQPAELAVAPATPGQRWLIFVDMHGLGTDLATQIAQQGHAVHVVRIGMSFGCDDQGVYTLDPRAPAHYRLLIQELAAQNALPDQILHLWSTNSDRDRQSPEQAFEEAQHAGFYSLLFLVQALSKEHVAQPIDLWVIANNIHDITGMETVYPEHAPLLAACRVIPQEFPSILCRCLDVLVPDPAADDQAQLREQIMAELHAKQDDVLIAYRGKHRWLQTFERYPLDNSCSPARLRPEGIYLITGGFGRLGQLVSKYLASTVRARLALLGRSPLPERHAWDMYLQTHETSEPVAQKIRQVQELEALGAEVLVLHGDVADNVQMKSAIHQILARFGALHGVIHAAGVTDAAFFRTIQDTGYNECRPHFAAKVYGLLVLDDVLRGIDLDFCHLASSLSTILGGMGYVAEIAADLYMDAFAERAARKNWLSLNWEGWHTSDQPAPTAGLGARVAQLAMTSEEVVETFQRALTYTETPRLIVSTGDLNRRIGQWIKLEDFDAEREGRGHDMMALHPRPNLSGTYVAPRTDAERAVIQVWQELLGIDQIGIHDDFFELGGHSLIGTRLITRLRKAFQIDLPLRALFEAPTVAELTTVIEAMIIADLEELDEESAQHLSVARV